VPVERDAIRITQGRVTDGDVGGSCLFGTTDLHDNRSAFFEKSASGLCVRVIVAVDLGSISCSLALKGYHGSPGWWRIGVKQEKEMLVIAQRRWKCRVDYFKVLRG